MDRATDRIRAYIHDVEYEWSWEPEDYEPSYYIWCIYAAERLIGMIERNPTSTPENIALAFHRRLENYLTSNLDSYALNMFWSYHAAISDIIEFYL